MQVKQNLSLKPNDLLVIAPTELPLDFYVYIHRQLSDDQPFYVGKGSSDRCLHFSNRSELWFDVASTNGVLVEIVEQGLTESQAYDLEIELIARFGRRCTGEGNLVNFAPGGPDKPSWIRRKR